MTSTIAHTPSLSAYIHLAHPIPAFLRRPNDSGHTDSPQKTIRTYPAFPPSPPCDIWTAPFSVTCYRSPVAADFTKELVNYYGLSAILSDAIHICLHESILNAVIHGNLAINKAIDSMETLTEYYTMIESRLASPVLCQTRVQIFATKRGNILMLEVVDEGDGYRHQSYWRERDLVPPQGLGIIQNSCSAVRVLGNGNHIQMDFNLA